MADLPVSALYGMDPPSEEQASRGLAQLQQRFEREAAARAAATSDAVAQTRALQRALNLSDAAAKDLGGTVQMLRSKQEKSAAAEVAPVEARVIEPRLFTGSIGATLTAPYNWPWTWHAGNGAPMTNTAFADNRAGRWSVDNWTSLDDSSNASSRAAVGVFFRPPTATGLLRVWSNPSLSFNWGDWCVLDGAGSDGWLGLYIGEYDVDGGGFVGAPVDQQIGLWSDGSWWSGVGDHEGSNSGYPLSATLEVDNAHFYEIWVWGGTDVYAAGWDNFIGGSGAGGELAVSVPSITWELH